VTPRFCGVSCDARRPPGHHNGSNEALEVAERDSFRFASHGGCLFNETVRHPHAGCILPSVVRHLLR
jgi:hypothetical protein